MPRRFDDGVAARAPFSYCADGVCLSSLHNPDSKSYAPVALLEFVSAPRIGLTRRFKPTTGFFRVVNALSVLLVKHDPTPAARLDMKDGTGRMFFSESSFPLSAVSLPASGYGKRDNTRWEVFTCMRVWHFAPAKQAGVISKCFINLVKAEARLYYQPQMLHQLSRMYTCFGILQSLVAQAQSQSVP